LTVLGGVDVVRSIEVKSVFRSLRSRAGALKLLVVNRLGNDSRLEDAHARLSRLLTNVDSALASFSLEEKRYEYVSPGLHRIFGRSVDGFGEDLLWIDTVHADDVERVAAAREALFVMGSAEVDYRVGHPDGRLGWVIHRAKLWYDSDGRPTRIDTIATDVTDRVEQQRQVVRLSRIRDVLSAVNSAIVRITEPALLLQEACRIVTRVGGLRVGIVVSVDVTAGKADIRALIGEYRRDLVEKALAGILADPQAAPGILAESLRSGRPVVANDLEISALRLPEHQELLATGVRSLATFPFSIDESRKGALLLASDERDFFSDEEVELFSGLTSNLAFALELAAKRSRIEYLSYYDPLTDLPNRTLALDRLSLGIAAAARRGERLALIVFDIHRFATVNLTFGDAAGDTVLRAVAQRLRDEIGIYHIARIAGDRFALVIPQLHELREVTEILSPAGLKLLAEPLWVGQRELRITAHVGCAVYPDDGATADVIFRNAEGAVQSAKTADVPYRFYAPELNERLSRRLHLDGRLRRAAANHEFVLHYQPKVELLSGALTGVEALLRWADPERPVSLVSPAEFIPILEDTGLIVEVGRWVLEEATRQNNAWYMAGLAVPRIAVNVSPVQLGHGTLVDDVINATRPYGTRSGIDLEVTETSLMMNVAAAIETLRQIRDLGFGVEIAIDDFGTGYSSLSYLIQLPISALKIDRTFIDGMIRNADTRTIVSTVISLGRELRLRVIAEGVETDAQAMMLRRLRCDQMQGFLIGRPMPAADLALLLHPRDAAV